MNTKLLMFRVVHIDAKRRRRELKIQAPGQRQAAAWAEQMHGDARYIACMRLPQGVAA